MKSIYLLALFLLFKGAAIAQQDGTIRGILIDTASKQPVSDATITVLNAKDSSLVTFSRSLQNGRFLVAGLNRGNYRLLITHIGYHNISKNFFITDLAKDLNLDTIVFNNKSILLKEVVVSSEVAPVTIKNDTVEFNAGSFKTKPNAVVEDLLKKLPGIQVDKNGTIKANGEEVKKVLVDGKEFFGNDPKIASKNLPADAVDKVQVFDKKSDQSQFTGFDDGNSQKAINLTIKQDKKNGMFGKATAGAGSDSRYEGNLNLNKFSGDQQLSLIGMANNTNKQGFSFQDVMNFTGGMAGFGGNSLMINDPFSSGIPIQGLTDNNPAITTTLAGGLNFNDTWNKKTDINGSYFYNGTNDKIDQKSTSQYLLPGNNYIQNQNNITTRDNENHRINVSADTKIDSFNSIKLSSTFIYQNSVNNTSTAYNSIASDSSLLNEGFSKSFSQKKGYSWNNNGLLRHRFRKKGRTISANLSFGLNNNDGNGSLYSINNYYQPPKTDTINQVNDLNGSGYNFGVNIAYTEPLSKRSLFEFNYSFNQNHSESGKQTFDADETGKYNVPNPLLTNDFNTTYLYNREGIHFRNQQKKFNFSVGATLQESSLKNNFNYLLNQDTFLHQYFLNFLPDAEVQIKFSKYRNLHLFYNTFVQPPSITQLQPVADNSDPLNIRAGNPNLEQEYYHLVRLNYGSVDPFRHTSFFAVLGYQAVQNKIVNNDTINSDGIRVSIPVNMNGVYNVNGNLSWGFPVRKIKSNLNLNTNLSYSHNANFVNGIRNNSNGWIISQDADLNFYHKELLDITGGAKLTYNDVRYSLQPEQNMHYWTQNYTLDFNIYLPKGFSIATDIDYIIRTGLPEGYNTSPFIWNAGLAKQLFKSKKGEIRFQVFDMLKQNIGFNRNTSQNYIQDISYKVLNRYFLLSFTYNISRFAGKSINGGSPVNNNVKIITN